MNEVKHAILDSIELFTNNMQYLAVEKTKTSQDIMLLIVLDEVYDWAEWYEALESELLIIQNLRKQIIRNNSDLVDVISNTNNFYKNASLPQTLHTWQRVYDKEDCVTLDTIPATIDHTTDPPDSIYDDPYTTPIIPS